MLRFRHFSISQKLISVNMLVTGAALLLACTAFVGYDLYVFRTAIVRNLTTQAQMIGSNSVSALIFDDPRTAEKTLSALKTSPRIVYAEIYDANGTPFAGYLREPSAPLLPLRAIPYEQSQISWFEGRQIALISSIFFQNKLVGFVYIRSDLQTIIDRFKNYALIAAFVFLLSLVVALLISRKSLRVVSEPVVHLAETARLVSKAKNYSVRATMTGNQDEISTLIVAFNDMLAEIQKRDNELHQAHEELEQKVQERTAQLTVANKELEAFSYSVSHDLRAPLRSIDGFSQALLEDYGDKLDTNGHEYLQRARSATQRMAALIDDLLNLARVTRAEMHWEEVDLSALAISISQELQKENTHPPAEFAITKGLLARGDSRLLGVVMQNLLDNAWKYSSGHDKTRIEVGHQPLGNKTIYFVRDDGAGFDPRYANRLFGAFQRLHSAEEFPGTGVGLATVQRIIHRHGGEIWAEGQVEKGATFYFTLSPNLKEERRE